MPLGEPEKKAEPPCSAFSVLRFYFSPLKIQLSKGLSAIGIGSALAVEGLPPILQHHGALFTVPPVIPASAVDTTSSFRYVIGIREAPPFYSRTPPSIVPCIKDRVNVSHDKSPLFGSRLCKISTSTLHLSLCSCLCLISSPHLRRAKAHYP